MTKRMKYQHLNNSGMCTFVHTCVYMVMYSTVVSHWFWLFSHGSHCVNCVSCVKMPQKSSMWWIARRPAAAGRPCDSPHRRFLRHFRALWGLSGTNCGPSTIGVHTGHTETVRGKETISLRHYCIWRSLGYMAINGGHSETCPETCLGGQAPIDHNI